MTPGPPLIGLAHGSRDPRAVVAITELMTAAAHDRPGLVTAAAFLDLSEPDLIAVLASLGAGEDGAGVNEDVGGLTEDRARLTEDGAGLTEDGAGLTKAVVVPLLFSEAFHATIDVPEAVAAAERATGVRLRTADILGLGPPVLRALRASARSAGITDESEIVLLAVGSSQPAANAAVSALADRWSAERAGTVHAAFATTEPRAIELLGRLRGQGFEVGIVPLFLAPGLLLDQVAGSPAATGLTIADPLGSALAGLVLRRYDEAQD